MGIQRLTNDHSTAALRFAFVASVALDRASPPMQSAISAHRAAWQAFQVSPDTTHTPAMMEILDAECEAYHVILCTIPTTPADLAALKAYLDWWVVEKAQRRESEPELFALHAALSLAAAAIAPPSILGARAELGLLLRYADAGIPIRRHNIERVMAGLDAPPTIA